MQERWARRSLARATACDGFEEALVILLGHEGCLQDGFGVGVLKIRHSLASRGVR